MPACVKKWLIYAYDLRGFSTLVLSLIFVVITVLTLTPNATNITVYEGDYSEICVTPNQLTNREVPSLFYVLFDDKGDYTADS